MKIARPLIRTWLQIPRRHKYRSKSLINHRYEGEKIESRYETGSHTNAWSTFKNVVSKYDT